MEQFYLHKCSLHNLLKKNTMILLGNTFKKKLIRAFLKATLIDI